MVLVSLNAFLGYCGVTGVFRPHFEVMFVLSLGLTACYYLYVNLTHIYLSFADPFISKCTCSHSFLLSFIYSFVYETAKIHAQEMAAAKLERKKSRKMKKKNASSSSTTTTTTTTSKKTE